MKVTPRMIASSLVDVACTSDVPLSHVCDAAIALLKKKCPSCTIREFHRTVGRELVRRGITQSGVLSVPSERSMGTSAIVDTLAKRTAAPVHIERVVDPDLIGGAVLSLGHTRFDSSVRGALKALHALCMAPIH